MNLTLNDWLTSSGKHKHRALHKEATNEVKAAAQSYIDKLNAVCKELHIKNPKFSSGFRPSDVNKKTPGASKTSWHMKGHAGDLEDLDGKIDFAFMMNLDVLEKHGLYLEDPKYTEKWAHTQDIPPKSGKRIFIP